MALAHPADTILPVIFLIYDGYYSQCCLEVSAWGGLFGPSSLHLSMYDDALSGTKKNHLSIHSSGNADNSRQRQGSISFAWHTAKA